jgi:2-aminoadipate transaminase
MTVTTLDRSESVTGAAVPRAGWTRSRLREIALLPPKPGFVSLAGGLPASELIPREAYAGALGEVLAEDAGALQYGQPYEPLKERIVELMRQRGIDCGPRQVLLTAGAQQALSLAAQLLIEPGGQVLMEEHVYAGLRQAVLPYRPSILTVRTDLDTGMDVDRVRTLLSAGARPAFIYAIADTHNPCGVRLGLEKRASLVALARRYGVPIVEDDSYGLLCYDRPPLPALRALDAEWVIHVGTFSKIIAPALRLGWLLLPPRLVGPAGILKEAADLECSALTQRAVARLLRHGFTDHLDRIRAGYRRRRDAMLAALRDHFPDSTRWTHPPGGFFVWVELPPRLDGDRVCEEALAEACVAVVPGSVFAAAGPTPARHLRLGFASCSPDRIRTAVERVGRLLQRRLAHG